MIFDISSPSTIFHAPFYIRHNQRRLEHLASLGLNLSNKTVLEPGAGIGDHSLFYLDRGCKVMAVEPRAENVAKMKENIKNSLSPHADNINILQGGVEALKDMTQRFEIVHSYGLLYHLPNPSEAIELFAQRLRDFGILQPITGSLLREHFSNNRVSFVTNVRTPEASSIVKLRYPTLRKGLVRFLDDMSDSTPAFV